ncbi:hypothetical protein TMPK1_20900 [Rhodospirillales bacterium TMPK1]|uniref:Tail specific protease domain-containing protein n=2 Tax=Roseiterribacter gracilis TaxID=2812848 RepID=A0A8S8X8S1_9PROT|nr:hypothetical protein TMPK1_20900 [Rhodospirillales bacterium TMPK1]
MKTRRQAPTPHAAALLLRKMACLSRSQEPPVPTRRSFLQGAAASFATIAPRAASAAPTIDVEAQQRDVAILQNAYEALHPGLYRYNTPDMMAARFAALRNSLSWPRTLPDVYLELARFTAAIRCGHTYPNPFNQSEAVQKTLFSNCDRLPLHFRWIGERMVVLRDLAEHGLERGSEIVALNGMHTSSLLQQLLPLARADGSNDGKRTRLLELRGVDRWEAFDLYMPLRFPDLLARETVDATVRTPAGSQRRVPLRWMTAEQRRAAAPLPARDAKTPWRMEMLRDGVALLTMPSWTVYGSDKSWAAELDADLDALAARNARALVIDLRGNEGGVDVGDRILARLIDAPLPSSYRRLVRYRRVPDELGPFLSTWDKSFRDWGSRAIGPDAAGWYTLRRDDDGDDIVKPAGARFRGRVVVLVDAANSSATFQFIERVRTHRLATLVGQRTGGNLRGINGGAFFFVRLPGSGLEVDLPLVGTFPPRAQPDAGITPDVAVKPTARDVATGTDTELEAALALLR